MLMSVRKWLKASCLLSAFVLFGFCLISFAGPVSSAQIEYKRSVQYPKVDLSKGNPALIKKGAYLVRLGDCISCHTATTPGAKPFAGGLGMKTPFGTFYTPNITPDKETGIGNWTDAELIKTFHDGIGPGGKHLFPVFPYLYFSNVTKQDIIAIRAYLNAIPAVHQPKRKNDVPFPFSWRFLQVGWRILFFDFRHHGFKYDPTKSQAWNRGAYIVNGLGHCGMCHTPIDKLGGPKNEYFLRGNFVGGYYAPDITGDALKHYTVQDVASVFLKGKMLGNAGVVQGPMEEAVHDSLQYLTHDDAIAIATYLKTVKSKPLPGASVPNVAAGSAKGGIDLAAGKKIYESKCSVCHATGAAGAPKFGNVADWAPRIKLGMKALYHNAIHGINSMPPKGTCMSCSDQQIKDAVSYMVDHSKAGAAGATTSSAPKGKAPEKTTLARGKKIYEAHCAACHKAGLMGAPKTGDKVTWRPIIKKGMPTLFTHTIKGFGKMPVMGGCKACNDGDIISAVKYMVNQSKESGNYQLW